MIGYKTYKKWPEEGDYVIVTYKHINPSSVLVEVDEYQGKKGMIHISELSTKWVKDIKKEIKLGKKEVAKVLFVDKERGYINLSVKRVKPTIKREKTSEVKNEMRAHNFLKMVAEKLNITIDEAYERIGFKLQKELGTMYEGFLLAKDSKEELKDILDQKTIDALEQVAKENIKTKELTIKGRITLISYESNALDIIKKALNFDEENIEVRYVSAPIYEIVLKGKDYISLEKEFKKLEETIKERLKGTKHEFKIERVEK